MTPNNQVNLRYLDAIKDHVLIYDGAMGTSIQSRNLKAEDFGGEDLVLLDSSAAGCIAAFVGGSGAHKLDASRLQVLGDCAQSLARICPHRIYFDTLREISERVLSDCRRESR